MARNRELMAVAALGAGKHVFCEQTAAYTLPDCERIVKAVKRTGKSYMMGENYCYFHYVREWKKLVDQGKLGHIYYAEGEYVHEIIDLLVNEQTGQYYWRHERPPIWYCAHTLGPILMLMDDRVAKGFNTLFLELLDDAHIPSVDAYGEAAFSPATDITRPVEAYWKHAEAVLEEAEDIRAVNGEDFPSLHRGQRT
jgi:predicted dehydrogenase